MALTTPAPLPGEWTFWCDTIVGGVPLGPVNATAFTAQCLLSGFGTGSVTLPSGSPALPPATLLALWSWRLWAFYAGLPVWCGVPSGIVDAAAGVVTLTLTELTGYLAKRVIDTVGGVSYAQAEQCQIMADLAAPLADVGVQVITQPGPGYLRDAAFDYLGSTARDQLLVTFAQQLSAPEFRTEYVMSGGRPACVLRIAYPRVGSDTGLGLTVPGNATAYQGTWDSDRMRTRTFATGVAPATAASGTPAPVVIVDQPQAGLPRLDAVDDYQDVSLVSMLTSRANTGAAQYASPAVALTGTIPAGRPPVGTYLPGDDVTVNVADPLLPGGLVTTGRVTEIDFDAAAGTAALTAATMSPAPRPRDTLAARLWDGSVVMARLSHNNLAPVAAQFTDTPGGTQ
jgi:hypothetical protein